MVRLIKKNKKNTNAKKRDILRLFNAPARYIKYKVQCIYKKLEKIQPKKTDNEVHNEEKLKRKAIDELKEIAKLRRIKNWGKLKKEASITSILKSESINAEHNYMKHFNNNNNNNGDDDTYDSKIRDKISDIRMILSRLRNTVNNNDGKKIEKELYEIENKKNLSDKEKEKIYGDLVKLVRTIDKKEKYKYHDREDLDYHGLRDIENLFDNVNDNVYYKPILVKSSFK